MKTYNAPVDVENKWVVIDATDVVVGRLASYVAKRLRGKHRPDFTPHIDTGDHVIVINAEKAKFTGNKLTDKVYYPPHRPPGRHQIDHGRQNPFRPLPGTRHRDGREAHAAERKPAGSQAVLETARLCRC